MEILSVIGLVALAGAALRRYVFTPERLSRTWDASLILVLITTLLVTFLIGQGAKVVAEDGITWSPIGTVVGGWLEGGGLSHSGAETLFLWMWWAHMLAVLGFFAYLPYSKHLHLLASPWSVFTFDLEPGGMPPSSEGASRLEEFTWRELYNALACAECGRCDRACPAHQSGLPLSPKDLIHGVKDMVLGSVGGKDFDQELIGEVISREEIWACTTCMACVELCPVFNEHVALITEMRRHLVGQGDIEGGIQDTLMNVGRYGNSFGKSPRGRAKWTRDLDFEIKDARKEPVEYLWFVGDYASFDPRVIEITRAVARVLHDAGVDFGILFEGEQNSGNDVRRLGEEGLFEMLREKNLSTLEAVDYQKIITTDPHSYHALKHEYDTEGRPVLHYTQVLAELLAERRIALNGGLSNGSVTYHDPCYLGRYDRVFDPPRDVLRAIGADLIEMPRSKADALCCGAGGGRIWMEDAPGEGERPAESRVREAAALDGVTTLVVGCPKDLVMFQDAVKTTGLEGSLMVKDVIELIEEASADMDRSAQP
jgi:Fe-S oxidoreductase